MNSSHLLSETTPPPSPWFTMMIRTQDELYGRHDASRKRIAPTSLILTCDAPSIPGLTTVEDYSGGAPGRFQRRTKALGVR